ncbi:MAG TPA: carboxypeptidase-like regulatory domain-containing protein [Chitinophagales bacterium]|nr:carboxypeptidase-like regulatory domain-containing protein [Chitinophagales bacterium]
MKKIIAAIILVPLLGGLTFGQNSGKLVQFSGLVLSSDSLMGIPYAAVIIKGQGRGTVANYQGFFSLVAMAGDKIQFSSIGFRPEEITIPDTLTKSKYSIVQLLTQDTVHLPTVLIYPWPSKEEFKQAFLALNIPDDDLERARKNMEREKLKEIGDIMEMDAKETTDYYFRQQAQRFYYTGQVPPQNIFNPIAWANFIEAWKRGDFKRKK